MAFLTKLEELFMLAVCHQRGPASLMTIRDYLLEKTGREWAVASLYIALDKLKKKGYVESHIGEPKNVRGGKAQRYYKMTKSGIRVLEEAWHMQEGLWNEFISSLGRKNQTDE
jgi:DNA-binding PadR family transcriptional regulator